MEIWSDIKFIIFLYTVQNEKIIFMLIMMNNKIELNWISIHTLWRLKFFDEQRND